MDRPTLETHRYLVVPAGFRPTATPEQLTATGDRLEQSGSSWASP